MKLRIKWSFGFTLAEVLITLGVIGIVAAMTIPTIVQKTSTLQTVSKLKKGYSTLKSAVDSTIQDQGTPDNWFDPAAPGFDKTSTENMLNYLNLRYAKNCGTTAGCGPDGFYKYVGGNNWTPFKIDTNIGKAMLADGSILYALFWSSSCAESFPSSGWCGSYYLDINGIDSPNQIGVDTFEFRLYKSGLKAAGTQVDGLTPFSVSCKTALTNSATTGNGCTAWVLYNENLDYLNCSDLDWGVKSKCQ